MEEYLCDRLRVQTRGGHRPEVRVYGGLFLVHSPALYEAPQCNAYMKDPDGKPWYLIDWIFRSSTSIIVPQQLNRLHGHMSLKTRLNLPVFFPNKSGGLGVTVGAAAASPTPGILGEEMILQAIQGVTTTHFVVHVRGLCYPCASS